MMLRHQLSKRALAEVYTNSMCIKQRKYAVQNCAEDAATAYSNSQPVKTAFLRRVGMATTRGVDQRKATNYPNVKSRLMKNKHKCDRGLTLLHSRLEKLTGYSRSRGLPKRRLQPGQALGRAHEQGRAITTDYCQDC